MDIRQWVSGLGQPKSQTVDATAATGDITAASSQPLVDLSQPPDTFERLNAPATASTSATIDQTGLNPTAAQDPTQPNPNQQNGDSETSAEVEHHVLKHFTEAANRDAGVDSYMSKVAQVFGEIPKS